MKDNFLFPIIIVFVFLLFMVAGTMLLFKHKSLLNSELERQKETLKSELLKTRNDCERYSVFTEAVNKISKKGWSEDYNCYASSKELQKELKELDIESSILINEARDHAWLAVWIEPQTGEFVDTNHEYDILEIRDSNLDVICSCR